jgi:hypothetical protein
MIRILTFCILTLVALMVPFPLFLFMCLLYLFFFSGFELLIITVVVDSFFGTIGTMPHYTLALGTCLILSELFKPYASWYSDPHRL